MNRPTNKIFKNAASAFMAVIAAATVAYAVDSGVDPDAWSALMNRYEGRIEARDATPPPVPDEIAITSGDWTRLVVKYENKYSNYGFTESDEGRELSRETLEHWFLRMDSETMIALVMRAFENNRDLAAARGRALEARAALGINRAAVLPWLDNADSWTHSEASENSASAGARTEITKLGIDASWEIDIFGGKRLKTEAAEASLEASYAGLHAVWVTLSSEVALNYTSFCTLQERLRIAERNLALQEETLSLLTSQYNAGLKDSLAMNQARYTVEQTKASIPPIRASMENVLNAMAILTGDVPGTLEDMLEGREDLPRLFEEDEFTGIPANALRQRPDIRAAERALASQIATRKSAEKDLLPKFFLVGSIGLETLAGGGRSAFSGDSVGFGIGPRITLPIFRGGAIRKNIQAQTAREEQLLAAYEGIVLASVAEVRNALSANTQEAARNAALKNGVEAAKAALEVADDRYKNGLTDFSNVIGAQVTLLSLEDALVISDGQMTSNLIRIFKALGGGWEPLVEENSEEAPGKKQ